jgi:hypothetical protein
VALVRKRTILTKRPSLTYPITKRRNGKGTIIQDIVQNNEYNKELSARHPNQCKNNKNTDLQHQKVKWVFFTYRGRETRKTTKLFKDIK